MASDEGRSNLWKTPETVMAFGNRYAIAGGAQARSGPAAQGGSTTGCDGRGRDRWRCGKDRVRPLGGLHPLKPLIREWLLELNVMGRSPRTIKWYEQKLDWYFRADGVVNLGGTDRLRAQALPRRAAGAGAIRQHHSRLLPGPAHVRQLGPSRGVPGRPDSAPGPTAKRHTLSLAFFAPGSTA